MRNSTSHLQSSTRSAEWTPNWLESITTGALGLAVATLPLAYGYGNASHFLEPAQHVFILVILLGMAGLGWQVACTGTARFYFSGVQAWGLGVVAGTALLHALVRVPDVPRTVLLLIMGLVWPSIVALAVRGHGRPWLVSALVVGVLSQSVLAGCQFLTSNGPRSLATTGTLFNAGSLGNYLAAVLPWLLGMVAGERHVSRRETDRHWGRAYFYCYCATAALAGGALALTSARAAWLGALVGPGWCWGAGRVRGLEVGSGGQAG